MYTFLPHWSAPGEPLDLSSPWLGLPLGLADLSCQLDVLFNSLVPHPSGNWALRRIPFFGLGPWSSSTFLQGVSTQVCLALLRLPPALQRWSCPCTWSNQPSWTQAVRPPYVDVCPWFQSEAFLKHWNWWYKKRQGLTHFPGCARKRLVAIWVHQKKVSSNLESSLNFLCRSALCLTSREVSLRSPGKWGEKKSKLNFTSKPVSLQKFPQNSTKIISKNYLWLHPAKIKC